MPYAPKNVPKPQRPGRAGRGSTHARGYGADHRAQRARLLRDRPLCEVCRSEWATDLHHKDHNPRNRDDANALMACEGCHHRVLHGRVDNA